MPPKTQQKRKAEEGTPIELPIEMKICNRTFKKDGYYYRPVSENIPSKEQQIIQNTLEQLFGVELINGRFSTKDYANKITINKWYEKYISDEIYGPKSKIVYRSNSTCTKKQAVTNLSSIDNNNNNVVTQIVPVSVMPSAHNVTLFSTSNTNRLLPSFRELLDSIERKGPAK